MAFCENTRKINSYHDGELPACEARELAEHVRRCPVCERELESLRRMSDWLSAAGELPVAVRDRLYGAARPRRDWTIERTTAVLTGVAASILIVCSVLLSQRWSAEPVPNQSPAPWERLAVAPVSRAARAANGAIQGNGEAEIGAEVDVEIVASILGGAAAEDGYDL